MSLADVLQTNNVELEGVGCVQVIKTYQHNRSNVEFGGELGDEDVATDQTLRILALHLTYQVDKPFKLLLVSSHP